MFWLIAFLSLTVSAGFTWCVRELARNLGLSAPPLASHHSHKHPTPRIGGIAIFLTFVLVYGLYVFTGAFGQGHRPTNSDVLNLLGPAALMFIVGLVDDLKGLRAWSKLSFQVASGVFLYFNGIRLCYQWRGLGAVSSSLLCLAITIFWIVLICNAINLIDGLDGLAAGAVLFSLVTIFTVAITSGRGGVATAAVVTAGALAGFLIFNFNPASIFLGDSGSLFLGVLLGGFTLAESPVHPSLSKAVSVSLVSLLLPITDTCLSIFRRFISGNSLFAADRDHIHHKLMAMGLSDRQAVFILYGCSAAGAILSLFLLHQTRLVIPVVGIFAIILFLGLRKLNYSEFGEFARLWKRVRQQRQVFARNIAIRKAIVEIEKIYHFKNLLTSLEKCLRIDFCGLEFNLAPELGQSTVPAHAKRVWREGSTRQSVLKLELKTAALGNVGYLSLFGCAEAGWLVDTDLLARELCLAVGFSIENCLSTTHFVMIEAPANLEAKSHYVDGQVNSAAGAVV